MRERRQLVEEVNRESESGTGLGITLRHLAETQAEIDREVQQKRRADEAAEHAAQIEKWKQTSGHPIAHRRAEMYPDRHRV